MPKHGPKLRSVITAELSKLCSLPITWIALGITFIVNLVLAFAFSNAALQGIVFIDNTVEIGLASISYAQAGFIVFGVLIICSEYNGGQIRTTLMAIPQRGVQLFAALFALIIILIPAAFVVSVSGFLLTQTLYSGDAAPIGWGNLAKSLLGVTAYLTLTSLISAAIGIILRRMLPALAIVLGYYFIAGPLIRDYASFAKYLPDTAGVVLWFPPPDHALTPMQGGIVLVAWSLFTISIAAIIYHKRDM